MNKVESTSRSTAAFEALLDKCLTLGIEIDDIVEGLNINRPLSYSDYLNLDILLALQRPKTKLADELIFIIYHQISELYFKLILEELKGIIHVSQTTDQGIPIERVARIIRYYQNLITSFDIVIDGIDKEQFCRFRLSLQPASAFQSLQYRLIEIHSTDIFNLVILDHRVKDFNKESGYSIQELFEKIYWKTANEKKGNPGLTDFIERYSGLLLKEAIDVQNSNLNRILERNIDWLDNDSLLKAAMRKFDFLANVSWPLKHFKAVSKYLSSNKAKDDRGTGGLDWKSYLPPARQKIIFFPRLWSESEVREWGKFEIAF
jgi:tryptophan 2,3-dioxygenase